MKNKSDFGVKIYTYSDIAFCMLRIMFGICYIHAYQKNVLIILLTILLGCKIATLAYIIMSDRITSNSINNLNLHQGAISKLNSLNKRMAFPTVVLPFMLQFIICYYIVAVFCIYASTTDYRILLWIICGVIALMNSIFAISAMDIFANEGFTLSIENFSFDTSKNYWGEGLSIIFWAVLYIILASYFCYNVLLGYVSNTLNTAALVGMLIFIASSVQSIKGLNIPDIFKRTFCNLIFFDYMTYMAAMIEVRREYFKRHSLKIILLTLMVAIFIINVACIVMIINGKFQFTSDIIASIICIGLISLTLSIFIIKRMCEAPLLTELFDDNEFTIYFTEYIDISETYKGSSPKYIE